MGVEAISEETLDGLVEQLQSLVSHIGQVIADICAATEWFIQTTASQIDNREIATVIVIIMLLLFVIANGSGKTVFKGFVEIISCALTPKLLIPALLLIAYSIPIFFLASHFGLWTTEILLDTILEVLFIGIPSMAIAVKAHTITSIFRQFVLPEIGFGALAAFYINIESFPLVAEVVLQFFIFFLTCTKAFGANRDDGKDVSKFSGCLLELVGVFVLVVATYQLIVAWSTVDWGTELRSLLMTFYYPALLLPYVIALGYYSAYEALGAQIKICPKCIRPCNRLYLYFALFPRLTDIAHFRYHEILEYAECGSWKERRRFCKSYKQQIGKRADKENAKLERRESGLGKRGFDQNGIWLDWKDLEKIKTELWIIAGNQNKEWAENHAYKSDLMVLLDVFTPRDCTGGCFVSEDCKTYACWMTNATGFTFGIGSSNGVFPPMRYEGDTVPEIDPKHPLRFFVCDDEGTSLSNWSFDFKVDESYR